MTSKINFHLKVNLIEVLGVALEDLMSMIFSRGFELFFKLVERWMDGKESR